MTACTGSVGADRDSIATRAPDPSLSTAQELLAPWVALTAATRSTFPSDPLVEHHAGLAAAYRQLLIDEVGTPHDLPAPTVGSRLRVAKRELLAAGQELQPRLLSLAATAAAGPAAWVLGSMSAGLAQATGLTPSEASAVPNAADLTLGDVPRADPLLTRLHEALWAVGLFGARTSASAQPALFEAVSGLYSGLRTERDALTAAMAAAGGTPPAAQPSYPRWSQVSPQPTAIRQAAARLEQEVAAAYAWVVYDGAMGWRSWCLEGWTRNAVRGLAFQGTPEIFPGASELTDRVRPTTSSPSSA